MIMIPHKRQIVNIFVMKKIKLIFYIMCFFRRAARRITTFVRKNIILCEARCAICGKIYIIGSIYNAEDTDHDYKN